jgi:hypothetical protein
MSMIGMVRFESVIRDLEMFWWFDDAHIISQKRSLQLSSRRHTDQLNPPRKEAPLHHHSSQSLLPETKHGTYKYGRGRRKIPQALIIASQDHARHDTQQ